tara:strand:+ start:5532 stop:5636 length:105 start_codon:yes stop_codon:yes gene_type:complete
MFHDTIHDAISAVQSVVAAVPLALAAVIALARQI